MLGNRGPHSEQPACVLRIIAHRGAMTSAAKIPRPRVPRVKFGLDYGAAIADLNASAVIQFPDDATVLSETLNTRDDDGSIILDLDEMFRFLPTFRPRIIWSSTPVSDSRPDRRVSDGTLMNLGTSLGGNLSFLTPFTSEG